MDTEMIKRELDASIPRDVISNRKAGNGISLSYLEGWYVIDRLNKVIGIGNWQYEVTELRQVYSADIEKNGRKGRAVSYLATVALTAVIGERTISFSDVGAGKGIDYNTGLEADESASKEAVTDALKRCAKNLGMSMGLALYDKTQENVSDEPRTSNTSTKTDDGKAANSSLVSNNSDARSVQGVSREQLNSDIGTAARVAIAKKKTTSKDLKESLGKVYGVSAKEDLTDVQAQEFLTHLRNLVKE